MPTLETIPIRDLSNAIIQKIDDRLAPANCVNFALNVRFDKILGRAVLREGIALVGSQITDAKSILGLHQFILSSGTKYLLAVVDGASNSALYRLITTTWTSESVSGAKAVKHRFLTYLDTEMILDGTNATSSANGDTWVTTGGNLDIGNCPRGKYVIEWNDRVWVAGVTGHLDRLYYSSTPSAAGVISWTVDNGYIDIEPYEGQGAISGLSKVPGYLLILKERSLKRWNGSSTFPDDLSRIGTPSQESIVFGKSTAFYFSSSFKGSTGFYETNSESTRKISRPIQGLVEAISSSNYSSIAGFSNGEIVMWSVGDITWDGISYSNVVFLYHIENETWTALGFPTKFLVFAPYIDGTSLKIIAGNNDGEIIEIFVGDKDNITGSSDMAIEYALQYHPMDFGKRGNMKEISSVIPYMKKGLDCKVLVRTDERGAFKEKGAVKDDFESEIQIDTKGHCFEFRLAGVTKSGLTQILGMDIMNPNIYSSIKK